MAETKNPHLGSSADDLWKELGIHVDITAAAIKRTIAMQIEKDACEMAKEAIELVVDLDGFKVTIEPGQNNDFFIIPNNIGPILAMILRQKRIYNGLSIRDVASRLGQSSSNSYGRYENGKSIPTIEKFDELLAAIDPDSSSILKVV